ncbi:MAG: succinylglutamate-semialdehyde dehydrogenase [Terrimicrobiaceae bacterium]
MTDPDRWINRCPGDLADSFPELTAGDPTAAVTSALEAFTGWRRTSLAARQEMLSDCRSAIESNKEQLAHLIAREVGKPLREARLEMDAVIAKFSFAFQDAEAWVAGRAVTDGPFPGWVRGRARGVAAVVSPFNFPIHLGHGAALSYLLAGNPVVMKPSPLAGHVAAEYGRLMSSCLPPGVFQIVQGWGSVGRELCLDPRVRSVCFTGSLNAGRSLATALAGDFSKSLALELGGHNALIVCSSADIAAAAAAAADGICLTAGQRCNATSRVLVHQSIRETFVDALLASLARYTPGDPCDESTLLGPLISSASLRRYRKLTETRGDWLLPGWSDHSNGWFAKPAILATSNPTIFGDMETFCPVATLEAFSDTQEAIRLQSADKYGLTASVFTAQDAEFEALGEELEVGNLYRNLPTTFSPSTLPFGGALLAGNGKPGGRDFVRFAITEQAVQWKV